MKLSWLRVGAILGAALLLTAAYKRAEQASVMSDAANAFLNSLWADQKATATYAFEDDQRFDWHFIPKLRKGLSFGSMAPHQKLLAMALVSTGLSQQGVIKATTIMSLDQVLLIQEGAAGPNRRDPENYYITIFGKPDPKGVWGFRLEGHHVAQNWTIVNGKIADSPSFFGSNPAEIKTGPRKGLRVLADEDDYGYAMIEALTPEQQNTAVVDKTALKDIITGPSRKASLAGQPNGLSAAKLTAPQYDKLMSIVELYAGNMASPMAEERIALAKKQPKDQTFFAWTGDVKRGGPHYYRVQTPAFLIEMDMTQDNSNHVHAVWRDYNNDFGLDTLKAHYEASHK
ncbi:MAG: hypothetical protein JWN34_2095 [Bryobacterales bacterium]|nr:hypothetical protein [Bryobacterales bacterium]